MYRPEDLKNVCWIHSGGTILEDRPLGPMMPGIWQSGLLEKYFKKPFAEPTTLSG